MASGVDPAQEEEGTAADDAVTAVTFSYANLKPKRLTGRYEFTHEMAASVMPRLEEALRQRPRQCNQVEDVKSDRQRPSR